MVVNLLENSMAFLILYFLRNFIDVYIFCEIVNRSIYSRSVKSPC